SRDRAQKLAVMSAKVVERGGMDYVQLYEIQRTVLNSEDMAVGARSDQLRASVDLYKSLGGGMKLHDDPCLGGGRLPEPDQRWIDEARKADQPEAKKSELSQPKSQLGIGSEGEIINEGTGQRIGEGRAPGVQNVIE
ncbi:MAG: hypothetical protein ACR2IJ_11115, partial [Fluviibacter sp.]